MVTDKALLSLSASTARLEYDELSGRDGWRIEVSSGVRYSLDERILIAAQSVFESVTAETERHGYRIVGLGVTISKAFQDGLTVSVSPSTEFRWHAAADPLFGKHREDGKLRLAARTQYCALRYRGFVPYIGLSFERNRSNIPTHGYNNHAAAIGVTGRF